MTTTTADDVRGHGRRNPSDGSDTVSDDTLAQPDDVVGHGSKRPTDEQADADDVRGHGFRLPSTSRTSSATTRRPGPAPWSTAPGTSPRRGPSPARWTAGTSASWRHSSGGIP